MEVRCERCRAQYVFADDQVGEHGLTVRCSNCGHLFKVKKKALVVTLPVAPGEGEAPVSAAEAHRAAAVQAAAQAVFSDGERRDWSLRQPGGQTYAYKDMTTLHRWIVERKAHREDEISRANEPWRRLGSIPELQSFFAVVEAAERAAQAPAAQPTTLQFPAAQVPVAGTKPAPARTVMDFPAQAKTAVFAPPPPRTETAVRPVAAPAKTAVFAPPPPAPPVPSRLEGIFTPDPMALPSTDPFLPKAPGEAADEFAPRNKIPTQTPSPFAGRTAPGVPSAPTEQFARAAPDDPFARAAPLPAVTAQAFPPPHQGSRTESTVGAVGGATEQGLPPPPLPAAPRPAAAWEGEARAAPAAPPGPEPAWTAADHQTSMESLTAGRPGAPARSGPSLLSVLLVILVSAGAVGGASWFFIFRDPGKPAEVPAPAPAQAAPAPAPAPAPPAAAPTAAVAPAAPPAAEPKPGEASPAAGQPAPAPQAAAPAPAVAEPPGAEPERAAPPPAAGLPAPPPAAARVATPPAAPPPAPAVSPAQKPPEKPAGAKQFIAQARKAYDKGKTKQALELYGKALEVEPENASALAGRGWCFVELSQYAQAEAAFNAALESDPKGAQGLFGLAETYRYEGRRADAVKFYERYLAHHPEGEDATVARNAIQTLKE